MFIFSHYLVFHNKPGSHYQLIYAISLPQHCQLKEAKGFLRSRLTDLSLICTTASQSSTARANKPPTTRPHKYSDYQSIVAGARLSLPCGRLQGWQSETDKCKSCRRVWMRWPWGWMWQWERGDPGDPHWIESRYIRQCIAATMTEIHLFLCERSFSCHDKISFMLIMYKVACLNKGISSLYSYLFWLKGNSMN